MVCSTFLEDVATRLDDLLRRASIADRTLTDEQINWKPGPDLWSIGQIFEHVHISNAAYLPAMERAIDSARYGQDTEVRHSFFGKLILGAAGPGGNAPAPRKLHPPDRPYSREVIHGFQSDHERLKELAKAAEGIDLTATRLQNPLVPVLRMNLVDCFAIAVAHAERHVGQIEELARRQDFPS